MNGICLLVLAPQALHAVVASSGPSNAQAVAAVVPAAPMAPVGAPCASGSPPAVAVSNNGMPDALMRPPGMAPTNRAGKPTPEKTVATAPGERAAAVREKAEKPIETYVDKEGWQTGVGYKGMEHYVNRLSAHLGKNLSGYVTGIAGGKKGILLLVTFKAQRNFYMAQENTKEFLTAIVNDLVKQMPEPVAPLVTVKQNGREIIRAEREGTEVKVTFLL